MYLFIYFYLFNKKIKLLLLFLKNACILNVVDQFFYLYTSVLKCNLYNVETLWQLNNELVLCSLQFIIFLINMFMLIKEY